MLLNRIKRQEYWLVLTGMFCIFTVTYFAYAQPVASPWDSGTMVVQGRMLAQHQSLQYQDINNERIGPYFNPMGYDIRSPSDPRPYSNFPPGFPLLVAVTYLISNGPDYLYVISPMMSVLGLIATAYIGYTLGGRLSSLLAVLLVGTSSVWLELSTSVLSDGPSISLLLCAIALYQFAFQTKRIWPAVISGLCLGLFVLQRFVNVAYAALLIVHVLYVGRERRWRLLSALVPGIGVGVVAMLAYQAAAYGGPFTNAYQAWGQNRFGFPLFSLRYLFESSPPPFSDYTLNAIVTGVAGSMGLWCVAFVGGLLIDRRNPWRLLLAATALLTILVYGVSTFTPRENMRYMLPLLAPAYILAADAVAYALCRLPSRTWRVTTAGTVAVICLGTLVGQLPHLAQRNSGAWNAVQQVIGTANFLPARAVVMAYVFNDLFAVYTDVSVLNYRKVPAPSLAERNNIVIAAIQALQAQGQPVYLVRDDERLFNTIYPALQQEFELRPLEAPLATYAVEGRHAQ
jgi:hypothetical protein